MVLPEKERCPYCGHWVKVDKDELIWVDDWDAGSVYVMKCPQCGHYFEVRSADADLVYEPWY